MYTIKKQKTGDSDIVRFELETITATRLECSQAQLNNHYFFEVEYEYVNMKGVRTKEIMFTYTEEMIFSCSPEFDMIAIKNKL